MKLLVIPEIISQVCLLKEIMFVSSVNHALRSVRKILVRGGKT